ncbi:phage tail tube protein [uncultured Paracoccus sp.]|uniref:phage tail tube protein n=1 Tax=uncultured Paracoccus sp. TaxID=189685 RepID=UPI0025E85F0F|nr:phage tail tube protein [uncultured Paracoccus sp.]
MPVEVASQVGIGWQDELWIGRSASGGGSTTWTQILGIETIDAPEKVPEDIDVTHMQSPGRTRETIPGLLAAADWSQELQYWPDHASQQLLDTLAALNETGEKEDVMVEFVVGGIRRTYRGYVNHFTPQSSVGEKRMATLSMKIFNRISPDPRVPEDG